MTELVETPYGVMSNDRRLISLSDLCASNGGVQTGPFGSQLHQADYVVDGMPIVTVEHLGDRRINGDEAPKVSSEDVARLQKYSLEEGDIVFSRVGSVDRCSLVTSNEAGWLFSGRCLRVRPKKTEVDSVFLSYFFRFDRFKDYIRAIAVGATMPSINTEIMQSVKVPLPPLVEQRAIASVLGALDDKIESNRRLAETIDGLLRVELENAILNDDDPREVRFGEIALRVGEASDPRNLREHVPYIGLEHMPRGNMFLDEWGTSEGLGSGKSVFKKGNVLFGRLRPYFKKVGVAPIDGICSTDVLVLKPAFNESAAMLLALAASEEFIGYASAAATGTKMPRVSWDYLSDWKTVLPSEAATNRFDNDMLPLVAKAVASVHEQVALAKLRDALLPELLSGRLRVKDAESMMESM